MSDPDPSRARSLTVVATASNEAEAELLQQRLVQAGIQAVAERVIGGPEWGASGARYIYVEAADAQRARELLEAPGEAEPGA